MLTCSPTAVTTRPATPVCAPRKTDADVRTSQHITDVLNLLQDTLAPQRRIVRAGDAIYQAGENFTHLYMLNSGFCKIVNQTADGREQVVGLKFRGDWMGFDGIANGRFVCDAIALDTGEVWMIRYDALLAACAQHSALLPVLHEAMSREIARDRDSLMSVCTLPADARVADFLRYWSHSLGRSGIRADQFTLRLKRADIGNYLGMTIETVSRSLTRLARGKLIQFAENGRRDIQIPEIDALTDFVQSFVTPSPQAVLH
ncbi:MAG: Crp/Fnr family transcriptional regulator [Pseudomonadota bacterium]